MFCILLPNFSILTRGGGVLPSTVGCAAGWGRIFTTGLIIMGSHIFGIYIYIYNDYPQDPTMDIAWVVGLA